MRSAMFPKSNVYFGRDIIIGNLLIGVQIIKIRKGYDILNNLSF